MRDNNFPHFVGIDVGTSAVRCVIGMFDNPDANAPSIIGYGSAPNNGMRKGVVSHIEDVGQAINLAIVEAERISGVRITTATVNINGAHVAGVNSRGVIAISTANREITLEDRERAEEAATIIQLPPNRDIIQVFAKNYRLDGQESIKDPVGMHGVRLEVDTHIITVSTPSLKSLDTALNKAGLNPTHHTVSSLAAAEAVLTRQQKESGTALIDIGAGTTNIVVFEDGEVQHVAVLPIGGINLTNDLAIGLRTDLDIAEAAKLQYGSLKTDTKKLEAIKVKHDGKEYEFNLGDIHMVLEARIDELFEYIDKELKKIHKSRRLPGGVVLVGGTSKLPGIAEFARESLELAARRGKLLPVSGLVDAIEDEPFDTAIGLMWLDMLLGQHGDSDITGAGTFNGLGSMVRNVFKKSGRKG
ncbi:cell division protein FtsA [Candidatus Saccharibacteria bacterium]|nr:cell division protein FtsA [Candidatus Saccharibacteria bacterium]